MVGGGPTCFAEIAAGWSELFFDIAAGWSKKSSADTPPSNFLNGIALTKMIAVFVDCDVCFLF